MELTGQDSPIQRNVIVEFYKRFTSKWPCDTLEDIFKLNRIVNVNLADGKLMICKASLLRQDDCRLRKALAILER